jgi:uncharacterized protein
MKRPLLTRRRFIFGSAAAAFASTIDAFCIEPNWLRITEHDVGIASLPKTLEGYRIAQITDAHLHQIGTVEERVLREIEKRNIGLVVLTGDMIDNPRRLNVLDEFCHRLQGSRRTVLAALGNWERLLGIPIRILMAKYKACGIRLLVNESVLIDSAISVAATDDFVRGKISLDRMMRGHIRGAANLFLTHSPAYLDLLSSDIGHFDLALSGHTHGGQGRIGPFAPFRPFGSGRFISGWYQVPIGRAYVSCGTGTNVMPTRFFCRPELPIFTLRRG